MKHKAKTIRTSKTIYYVVDLIKNEIVTKHTYNGSSIRKTFFVRYRDARKVCDDLNLGYPERYSIRLLT